MTRRRDDTRTLPPRNHDPERAAAHDRLLDLIIAHHGDVPCLRGDTAPASWWTDESAELQAAAAAACQWCPSVVNAACERYGLAHPRESGTYGGLTEGQRQHRGRATA